MGLRRGGCAIIAPPLAPEPDRTVPARCGEQGAVRAERGGGLDCAVEQRPLEAAGARIPQQDPPVVNALGCDLGAAGDERGHDAAVVAVQGPAER